MHERSDPVLLWGRASAHVCLGQSQDAGRELSPAVDLPVVRRPLGGGTVWIDENQLVYALIMPLRRAPSRPADWSAWALRPAVATFRHFGLEVVQHHEDLWLGGRKIAGSGSATIGGSAVIASSFLLRFPRARFAACIAGSPEFRGWLTEALASTLTDWSEHAPLRAEVQLRAIFYGAVGQLLGWRLQPAALSAAESAAIDGMMSDVHDDDCTSRRMHPDGIKLNADSHLVERDENGRRIRELVVRGALTRRAVVAI